MGNFVFFHCTKSVIIEVIFTSEMIPVSFVHNIMSHLSRHLESPMKKALQKYIHYKNTNIFYILLYSKCIATL